MIDPKIGEWWYIRTINDYDITGAMKVKVLAINENHEEYICDLKWYGTKVLQRGHFISRIKKWWQLW